MADLKNPKQSWEMLPAYLNLVLIQTGKLLRDSDYRGPKAIGIAKSKVNEYVSAANGSFHDALDEVETKILDAKSVMERDLSAIRKRRALREGVKIPMPAPSPIEIPTEMSNEAIQIEALQIHANGDLPMLDVDNMTSQIQNGAGANETPNSGDGMMIVDQAMSQDVDSSAGLAITQPGEANPDEKDGSKPSNETNQDIGAKMEDIMGTSDGQEQQAETNDLGFDFESMFNDTEFAAADGSMDFNLDFSGTGQLSGPGHSESTFGNLATTGANLGSIPPASNEDITGLLDEVFNQAGDAANGVPSTISTAPDTSIQGVAVSAQPAESGAPPSEFSDLFGTDTFDLGGDDDVTGSGNLADFNFDEEWL